jgi:pilus assembly protein Flp/PilA
MLHFDFIKSYLTAQAKTERGATLVEYALLVALIAVVCIAAVTVLGESASAKFSDVNKNIANANP